MKNKSIENQNFIEAVQERDIDLLLLEEITVSVEFREWIVKQITGEKIKKFVEPKHSVSDSNSEFDIVLIFISESGKKHALLIEDKIGAMAQKNQPQRYSKRGDEGVVNREWDVFKTCIIAPERYLKNNKEAKEYSSQISYEAIGKWFLEHKSERYDFKNRMIKEAIEQNRRGYTKIPDEKTTDFHKKYYVHVKNNCPELEMREPRSSPAGQSWIYFSPRILKKKMYIVHKGDRGVVDLQIDGYGDKLDSLQLKLKPFIKKNMGLAPTNKSASLRIDVPLIDVTSSFDEQIEKINKALKAGKRLLKIGNAIVDDI